jgi:hypothetical protein
MNAIKKKLRCTLREQAHVPHHQACRHCRSDSASDDQHHPDDRLLRPPAPNRASRDHCEVVYFFLSSMKQPSDPGIHAPVHECASFIEKKLDFMKKRFNEQNNAPVKRAGPALWLLACW